MTSPEHAVHIYRWDLDKTYLDTDIHSVRSMIKAAFETAHDKRNVPGSAALLRNLIRTDPSCQVAVVSGSPEQLRTVLAEKLALDGIRVDTMVLKDHLGNLRRGRLKAVYGQLGYKLPAILEARAMQPSTARETLFGDDTEVDAVIYTLFAEAVAGRLDERTLKRVMSAGVAYRDSIDRAIAALRSLPHSDAVDDVFIHVDRGVPIGHMRKLGARCIPVFSWFQAAAVLWCRGRLDAQGVAEVAVATTQEPERDVVLAAWLQDIVRRGHITRAAVDDLLDGTRLVDHTPSARRRVHALGEAPSPRFPSSPDFLGFLSGLSKLS